MAKRTARAAAKKSARAAKRKQERETPAVPSGVDITWRTKAQKEAWLSLPTHQISFLLGSAGSGKTFLAMAFAINEVLAGRKQHIVLTRPIVESGEKLGFLPGSFGEKVNPYMQPLYDTMDTLLGKQSQAREIVNKSVKLAPLCYMRGRTFNDSVCILDEAQNATYQQFKLFLSRFGENSSVIVTGDPFQSDLGYEEPPLVEVTERLLGLDSVHFVYFEDKDVVRNPLITEILRRL